MINLAHNILFNGKIIHVNAMSCFVNNIITEMVLKNQRNQVDNEHAFTSPATAGSFKKLFGKIIWYAKTLKNK